MAATNINAGVSIHPMATLYVGDLHSDVTEAMLFDKFASAGPVLSIRVCRDMITRRSLGYAYVNFQQPSDAERALDTMNHDTIRNRSIRIMWCQRDPALRKSGVGNIFIKNLDKAIDHKSLQDTFSAFGNILSCKIMTDENGESKGFGFVHFETKEAADKAIDRVNGMLLADKKVYVGPFMSRAQRGMFDGQRKFTNVFIKNFADLLNDEKLHELFSKFGTITSCIVVRDADGNSKGFGFCNFEKPEDAEKAVQDLNDTTIDDRKIYVGRFKKKAERLAEIRRLREQQRQQRIKQSQSVNLFIKNLDDTIDDTRLKDEFEKFGRITSAKVMIENGRSKGFGFVCFSAADEATKAVTEMNGAIVGSKPLYVALAQLKQDRQQYLAHQRHYRATTSHMNQHLPLPYSNGMNDMMPPYMRRRMPTLEPHNFYPPTTMPPIRSVPRWPIPMNAGNIRPQAGGQMMSNMQMSQPMMAVQQRAPIMGGFPPRSGMYSGARSTAAATAGQMMAGSAIRAQTGGPQQAMYTQAARNVQQNNPTGNPGSIIVPGQEPLTAAALANASLQEQKQMLGERLFPLIHRMHPELAGKITGMLLEIDNTELLHMLESHDSLRAKVDEAIAVLQAHHVKQAEAAKQAAANSAAR